MNFSPAKHAKWIFFLILVAFTSLTYAVQQEIILIADPRVSSITITENQEPLIDLKQQSAISYGPSPEIPNNSSYIFLRKTIYEKLIKANAMLPKGIHLCVYEGFRDLDLQEKLFTTHYRNVKTRHPDWHLKAVFNETIKLVVPVLNQNGTKNIPPHSTGGAVDVYLIDDSGKALDMGLHPQDWMKDKDAALSMMNSKFISKEAKANRELMARVLAKVGFVNYPIEYWHWSYGDRYWAYVDKQPLAVYGMITATANSKS